jgi:catechol 2,3-dioxygenase
VQVADLDRSIGYYTDVVGLRTEPLASDKAQRRALLRPQDDDRVLIELRERPGARRVPERGLLGLFHFAIVVPDRATLGRVLAHLIDAAVPFGAADHMVSEALYLTDPDGLGIELYRDRPRAEWIIRNGRVIGGSDPLDTAGILAAAERQAWGGLPAGTRMGHVHFHVGDLPRAEAFYHRGLGFDVVNWRLPGALFLSAGGYHHHVGLNTWAAGAPPASEGDARLIDWALVVPTVDDAKSVAESLAASDYAIDVRSGEFAASDPWGTVVRLHASGPTS